METQLGTLARLIGGTLTDPAKAEVAVSKARSLDQAGPGDLAFLWSDKYREAARTSQAEAIICREPIEGKACILVDDPQQAMLALLGQVHGLRYPPLSGVHPQAFVDPSATLQEGVAVGPLAVVDAGATVGARCQIHARAYVGRNVRLGDDCEIHPNATVLDHCTLGDRVVVWSGAVIGKAGFGFLQRDGRHVRIPQVGGVVLEDDVEVGAVSTIARGALEDTVVRRGVKIDDHCNIAHNCEIGENAMLIGYARMGGSVTLGRDVYLMQDARVGQGLSIGEGAMIGSGAGVKYADVEPGARLLGEPARHHIQQKRIEASLPKLPEMNRRLKRLEQQVDRLAGET